MGRPLRKIEKDCIYHVMCRGSNRGLLAWDRHDYASLAAELAKAACRYRWDVFAWCLLSNHYHVLLRTPLGGFSDGFQLINGSHSRRTNRRHGRSDHLFRNRPHSVEVKSEAHLAVAILYIARNPVEAGLCGRAAEWSFGSYRALAGHEPAPSWLAVGEVHALFGIDTANARAEFARLVGNEHLPVSDTEEMPWPLSP